MAIGVLSRLHKRGKRVVSREMQLMKAHGLSKWERVEMIARGVIFSQFAVPIGSFVYFLLFQAHYGISYQNADGTTGSLVNVWFKDSWDRLPIHIDNLFNQPFFVPLGTVSEPTWWIDARHDLRKVLIGFVVTLLLGAITIGFKKRERASVRHMILRVPLAFLAATATAVVLIWGFLNLPSAISTAGTTNSIPYIRDYLGSGQLELLIIGVVAGLVAKRILARTFDTLQFISIERNLAQRDVLVGRKRFVYGPNYSHRYAYYEGRVKDGSFTPKLGHRVIGIVLITLTPVMLVLLSGGIWLLYFGPAAGTAH